ncbi:MAG: glycogen debranching enzyme N-terminal domain-containing protein [Candidatus Moduliflexus flocculans]|nr:glycogen debranching enzyme N-terminal domain-containing protein [Candidatus Moduliflexus flocculans]
MGCIHIEQFRLEGTIPTWTFAIADALLEKRIWMQPGKHYLHSISPGSGNRSTVSCYQSLGKLS